MAEIRCILPKARRRLPVGAEALPGGGIHVRVWAPRARRVEVVIEGGPEVAADRPRAAPLAPEGAGYFSGVVDAAGDGTRYRYRLDAAAERYPDPASRFQPDGPHGPSEVVDPGRFQWTDHDWSGVRLEGQVVYEMHVGTFTREGTWDAARRELPELTRAGITLIEVTDLLHCDLLRLRREDPVFRAQRPGGLDGAVLGPHVFVLRLFGQDDGDRLLLVNLGPDWPLEPAPEPLLAPPENARWTLLWSSEVPRYGGSGIAPVDPDEGWVVAGESATVFRSEPRPPVEPVPPTSPGPPTEAPPG